MNLVYRSKTGETRDYLGWQAWAENFYTSLSYDEMGRSCEVVNHLNIMMPKDWFARITRVLKLEPVYEG